MPFYMILQSKGSESDYRINKKLPCIGQNYAFCRICPVARRTLYEAQSKTQDVDINYKFVGNLKNLEINFLKQAM